MWYFKQGDVYTWGWNNQGQLGHPKVENVAAIPSLIDFTDEKQEIIELNVIKAQCGSTFTICQTGQYLLIQVFM